MTHWILFIVLFIVKGCKMKNDGNLNESDIEGKNIYTCCVTLATLSLFLLLRKR